MGRRKQANPTRLTEDIEDTGEQKVSTSSNHESQSAFGRIEENGLKNGKETDKKSCINFSISAHLQPDSRDDSKINKSSKHTNSATIDTSYQAAQKAYQTLMSNLKQQEAMMKSMASNPAAAAFFMNPFFGAGMPPFDFFSSLQAMAPKRKHKEDDSAIDLTKKKRIGSENKATKSNEISSNSALDKLSSLVTNVGNSLSPMSALMRTQNTAFGNGDPNTDPTRVFTCLQCFDRFQSMEELVDHMGKTLHFNQLKALAMKSPLPINKNTNSSAKSPSPNDRARSSSRGGTSFSFECLLCGHSSSGSIDEHMTGAHNFSSPNDWISAVKLIPL